MKQEETFRTVIITDVEVRMLNGMENALRYTKLKDNETIVKVDQKENGAVYVKIKEVTELFEAEDLKEYLKELTELCKRHNIYIDESCEELILVNGEGLTVAYDIRLNYFNKEYIID